MKHIAATDILNSFTSGLEKLNYGKMFLISVDGPRVNWKFLSMICEERSTIDASLPNLLNIWSCSLYVVHMESGTGAQATGWYFESSLVSVS